MREWAPMGIACRAYDDLWVKGKASRRSTLDNWKSSLVSRTFSLPHHLSSASLARRHVEQFAADQMLDDKTKALAIIATELVTNAVLHGAEPVKLRLRRERDAVTIEVTDGDRQVDRVRIPAAHERTAGGKGLLLVESLADRWGARLAQTGKTVWATMNTAHA